MRIHRPQPVTSPLLAIGPNVLRVSQRRSLTGRSPAQRRCRPTFDEALGSEGFRPVEVSYLINWEFGAESSTLRATMRVTGSSENSRLGVHFRAQPSCSRLRKMRRFLYRTTSSERPSWSEHKTGAKTSSDGLSECHRERAGTLGRGVTVRFLRSALTQQSFADRSSAL